MAGFEDLIRGALIKQGTTTPESRQQVYNSARQALARMTADSGTLDPGVIQAQRDKLEKAIAEIEQSYRSGGQSPAATPDSPVTSTPAPPAAPQPAAPAPAASSPPASQPISAGPTVAPPVPPTAPAERMTDLRAAKLQPAAKRVEPGFEAPSAASAAAVPEVPLPAAVEDDIDIVRPEANAGSGSDELRADPPPQRYSGPLLRERRPYAKLLLWTIILVGIGVSIWWAITFGPALLLSQFDGSVPNPRPSLTSDSFVPDSESGDGWLTVFVPDVSLDNVVSYGESRAELVRDEGRAVLRIVSPNGDPTNNILIKVPRGILDDLQGLEATFEVTASSTTNVAHEFGVFCEFSQMGNCSRKRFKAGHRPEAFPFDVLLNDVRLPDDEDGYLAINTDVQGNGTPLDLHLVRVRTDSR